MITFVSIFHFPSFLSSYEEDRDAKTLLKEYDIPDYFRDDLFKLVGESRRPPYRWFLIGPARSGDVIKKILLDHETCFSHLKEQLCILTRWQHRLGTHW